MSHYGITVEEFERRRVEQGGACAICLIVPIKVEGKPEPLHVDHDHETGTIRGLLCGPCNTSLGGFKDDPAVLQAAIDYLARMDP